MSTRTVVELSGRVLVVVALICMLSIPKFARHVFWGLHVWRWSVLIIMLRFGSLLSDWLIHIIVFFLERSFKLGKCYLYFMYGVRGMVHNCIWLGLILLTCNFLSDGVVGETKALSYITKTHFCLIVAAIIRLVKTLLFKVLAFSFHVTKYFDRIQGALLNQSIIHTLSGPPFLEIQKSIEEGDRIADRVREIMKFSDTIPKELKATATMWSNNEMAMGRSGGIIPKKMRIRCSQIEKSLNLSADAWKDFSKQRLQHDGKITIDQLLKLNQKNISAWNLKRLMRIVRYGTLTLLDMEKVESTMQITSEHDAKLAARKIFINVAKSDRKSICLVDLTRFMSEDEAVKTMCLLSGARDASISEGVFRDWVVNAFRDRRALSLTLDEIKTSMNRLHQIVNVLVDIIVIAIWLLILNIATTQFFVFLGSQILLAGFVLRNTFKKMFEAVIFLFVTHPFDVGDHCEVSGTQMVVKEMNLLTTTFLRLDESRITYPNSMLATLPIINFQRSPNAGNQVDFYVQVSTPLEKIALMKEKIIAFTESAGHWRPGTQVVFQNLDNMNMLKISIIIHHQLNFLDMWTKLVRRELVVQQLIRVLMELDIGYSLL